MSQVLRGNKYVRPSFRYNEANEFVDSQITAQVCESMRNVLEQIRDSQVLSCSVASDLAAIKRELRGLRRDLAGNRKRRRKKGRR